MKIFPNYLNTIARANGLGNTSPINSSPINSNVDWLFYQGMLQDSQAKWWADFGVRSAVHEGIDICFYRTCGKTFALDPSARVPALADGIILNISTDLLGQSMAVSFDPGGKEKQTVILVYSHLKPDPGLAPGDPIFKDQIIAQTYDARLKKSRLLSHLHISCVLIPPPIDTAKLTWSLFSNRNKVTYVNPVFL